MSSKELADRNPRMTGSTASGEWEPKRHEDGVERDRESLLEQLADGSLDPDEVDPRLEPYDEGADDETG